MTKEVHQQQRSLLSSDTLRPVVTPAVRFEQVKQYLIGAKNRVGDTLLLKSQQYELIPKKWIGLWFTGADYVEYKPCNGINYSLEIKGDTLLVNWTSETVGYQIKEINIISNGYVVRCWDEPIGHLDFTFKEVLEPSNTYHLSWSTKEDTYNWLLTQLKNRYDFGFITNPCLKNMLPEKRFEEIDFSKLKVKKR
jgi:hypothetical protein